MGDHVRSPMNSVSAFGFGGPAPTAAGAGRWCRASTAARRRAGRHGSLYSALQTSQASLDAACVTRTALYDQPVQLSLESAVLLDQVIHHLVERLDQLRTLQPPAAGASAARSRPTPRWSTSS